jgi:hypothetical protein
MYPGWPVGSPFAALKLAPMTIMMLRPHSSSAFASSCFESDLAFIGLGGFVLSRLAMDWLHVAYRRRHIPHPSSSASSIISKRRLQ